jgi:hypothetical protein
MAALRKMDESHRSEHDWAEPPREAGESFCEPDEEFHE